MSDSLGSTYVGVLECDVLLGAVDSLKHKRAIIRPIVIILTLPAVILTLGILLLFINAFTLWIADKIVPPFEVSGFWTYLGSVIIIWLVNMIVYGIFRPENRETKRELTA